MKRSLLAGALALGLLFAACGSDGDGKLSGTAADTGQASLAKGDDTKLPPKGATTTTARPYRKDLYIAGSIAGTTNLSLDEGLGDHWDQAFGHLTTLNAKGPGALPADLNVKSPSGAAVKVVGVMQTWTWTQKPSDPITMTFRVSDANARKLAAFKVGAVNFALVLSSFDPRGVRFFPSLDTGAATGYSTSAPLIRPAKMTPTGASKDQAAAYADVTFTLSPAGISNSIKIADQKMLVRAHPWTEPTKEQKKV